MTTTAFEQHFRTRELARMWSVSPKTILRRFRSEPGVARMRSGKITTLLIPASVACRVYERLCEQGHAGRVALFGDTHGGVPQQARDIADRDAPKPRASRESIAEAVRAASANLGR